MDTGRHQERRERWGERGIHPYVYHDVVDYK